MTGRVEERCALFVGCCVLFVVKCLVCGLWLLDCRLLFVAIWFVSTCRLVNCVRCVLLAVCCLLFVVCCGLFV